jgi:hypothetical protein
MHPPFKFLTLNEQRRWKSTFQEGPQEIAKGTRKRGSKAGSRREIGTLHVHYPFSIQLING